MSLDPHKRHKRKVLGLQLHLALQQWQLPTEEFFQFQTQLLPPN